MQEPSMNLQFEPEVALAPQWLREAFKKITILFLTFIKIGFTPLPLFFVKKPLYKKCL